METDYFYFFPFFFFPGVFCSTRQPELDSPGHSPYHSPMLIAKPHVRLTFEGVLVALVVPERGMADDTPAGLGADASSDPEPGAEGCREGVDEMGGEGAMGRPVTVEEAGMSGRYLARRA